MHVPEARPRVIMHHRKWVASCSQKRGEVSDEAGTLNVIKQRSFEKSRSDQRAGVDGEEVTHTKRVQLAKLGKTCVHKSGY